MRAVRVLHVVGQMNRGGVETWLMQVLRSADPARLRMEFLTTRAAPGDYDDEIRARGSRVLTCAHPRAPLAFARDFLRIAREQGPFDVVHSHVHHFSGFVLALARRAGVRVRIAHSHSDTSGLDRRAGVARRLYLRGMKAAVRRHATHGLGASEAAAAALFGREWRDDARWRVSHCAIDLSPFREPLDAAAVRAELGIPAGARVVGHVGRLDAPKNHAFLLRIALEVLRRDPRAFFVLVGEGPLRERLEGDAGRLAIRDRIVFTGARPDVPRLLRAFDAFLFPSTREGLPLVGLEAQAAGLPIVLSETITRELAVVPLLFSWCSLAEPPSFWADAVVAALGRGRAPDAALALLDRSDFAIQHSVRTLERVYGA